MCIVCTYRCYLFDKSNRIERVIDFGAPTDAEACHEAAYLNAELGHGGLLELWSGEGQILCSGLTQSAPSAEPHLLFRLISLGWLAA